MSKVKKNPPTFPWLELASVSWRELVPLKDVFDRIMLNVGAPDLAALCLYADLRDGRLRLVVVCIAPDKKHTVTLLTPSNCEKWRQVRALAGDVTLKPPVRGYCLVPRVDRDKWYPMTSAAHPSDDTRPPQRRRGPVLKYDWHTIAGEIACRCIDPETGRVAVPEKESALVFAMRKWCEEQGWVAPALSEMSEAVRRVCAALRSVQK
jgi:hypothetical protein